ncbi:MAG TPA: cell division protein SepF [Candidatus Acidoferrales bacterium]|nr:cell division protein SepF [Candidatus Acidoferrales bacterium]
MPFNLFHKKKQPEQQTLATPSQEQPLRETALQEAPAEQPQPTPEAAPTPTPEPVAAAEEPKEPTSESAPIAQEQPQENPPAVPEPAEEVPAPVQEESKPAEQPPAPVEQPKPTEPASKTYLKAMPLKDLADIETVKNEVRNGNIIILRITPLAGKSIEDVKTAVNDLFAFAESIQGDIARLGEERVVICPKPIRIWREKTPAPVTNKGPLPTAA